jgi:putative protein kinase ArgK-like GTPase of G3E family
MLDLGAAPRTVSHHGATMTVNAPNPAGRIPDSGPLEAGPLEAGPVWRPPILQTVALEGKGISQVVDAIARHQAYLAESGEGQMRYRARVESELEAILRETLLRRLMASLSPADLEGMVDRIAARELDPHTAAENLLAKRP